MATTQRIRRVARTAARPETELALMAKLAQKIQLVMKAVDRLPKDGKNTHFNYRFVTEGAAIDAVRNACCEYGIVILPSVLAVDQNREAKGNEQRGNEQRGGDPTRTRVTMAYDIVDTETGYVRTLTWSGECLEAQDKGVNKAIVSAGKYFLLKTFMIPTGDDPDASGPVQPATTKNGAATGRRAETPAPTQGATPTQDDQKAACAYLVTLGIDNSRALQEFKAACKEPFEWVVLALKAKHAGIRDAEQLYRFVDGASQGAAK